MCKLTKNFTREDVCTPTEAKNLLGWNRRQFNVLMATIFHPCAVPHKGTKVMYCKHNIMSIKAAVENFPEVQEVLQTFK